MHSNYTDTVNGVLEKIIFLNEENAYCIAELTTDITNKKITIYGTLANVQCGETLSLQGNWVEHEKHGTQFKVSTFSTKLPASIHGIKKYLGSGLVHGIGKSYANKIVNYFGTDTLDIISKKSARLAEVPGIGKSRIKSIKEAWEEQAAVRDVLLFLQTYGVTPAQCLKLVKKYGLNAKRIIQDQPYKIADEIERIGFKTADQIALNLGFSTNSKERIHAGILHSVSQIEEKGHTISIVSELIVKTAQLLSIEKELITNQIKYLITIKKLFEIKAYNQKNEPLGLAVQSARYTYHESKVSESINLISQTKSILPKIKLDAALKWIKEKSTITFEKQQLEAIKTALVNKVSIITGGPGTGKTTILRAIVEILSAKRSKIVLASPTGRAAQKLSSSTKKEATTIHRLLKFDPSARGFFHNKNNPIVCDCIIIDEASMIDTLLASALFEAIPYGAHLILVGDSDQLPSVGAGNILSDLQYSPQCQVVRLEAIYRQSCESQIITTAHDIIKGISKPSMSLQSLHHLDPKVDFNFIEVEDDELMLKAMLYLVKDYLPKSGSICPIQDIQVLSPMHKGNGGIQALNQALQNCLNNDLESKKRISKSNNYKSAKQTFFRERTQKTLLHEITFGTTSLRLGDKVIKTVNNYDKNVFNGDMGVINSISADGSGLTILFSEKKIEYKRNELHEIQLAYALSIHKSQGSEYPIVILPLLKQHFVMLQRNLLYTAITRAKEKLYIIGSLDAYAIAVKNNKTDSRQSNLIRKLKEIY